MPRIYFLMERIHLNCLARCTSVKNWFMLEFPFGSNCGIPINGFASIDIGLSRFTCHLPKIYDRALGISLKLIQVRLLYSKAHIWGPKRRQPIVRVWGDSRYTASCLYSIRSYIVVLVTVYIPITYIYIYKITNITIYIYMYYIRTYDTHIRIVVS